MLSKGLHKKIGDGQGARVTVVPALVYCTVLYSTLVSHTRLGLCNCNQNIYVGSSKHRCH
jgi:hypothetical protein